MKTTQQQKSFISGDIWEASFLAYRGLSPNLEFRNGRVFFLFFISNELYQSLSDFNSSDVSVNLAQYIDAHKRLKTSMMRLRDEATR